MTMLTCVPPVGQQHRGAFVSRQPPCAEPPHKAQHVVAREVLLPRRRRRSPVTIKPASDCVHAARARTRTRNALE